MPTIRELLATQPPSAINARVLTRAIAEHDEWYVTMLAFPGREQFGAIVLPPDGRVGSVPGELWMFSDRQAVDHAPQQIGFGSMSGIELCASLHPELRSAQLNPGSPDFLSMQLPDVVRSHLAQLAAAVPFERELAAAGSAAIHGLGPDARMFIAISDGVPLAMATNDGRVAAGILAFTAGDAVDGLFERLPREKAASVNIRSITARDLFHNLGESKMDGILINPFGPRATTIVPREDVAKMVERAKTAWAGG